MFINGKVTIELLCLELLEVRDGELVRFYCDLEFQC